MAFDYGLAYVPVFISKNRPPRGGLSRLKAEGGKKIGLMFGKIIFL